MNKSVHIFVNGILNFPGGAENWNGRAATWCLLRGILAERFEYYCGPISRAFGQWRRARKLAGTISYYLNAGFTVNIAAHSNGADVTLKALRILRWPKVGRLHLISAATDADFDRNGLNNALRNGAIESVTVYVGARDLPLWLVKHSRLARWIGFGALGLGPRNVCSEVKDRVRVVRRGSGGHSDWFDVDSGRFDELMKEIERR